MPYNNTIFTTTAKQIYVCGKISSSTKLSYK